MRYDKSIVGNLNAMSYKHINIYGKKYANGTTFISKLGKEIQFPKIIKI